jgi:hypothetical protein
MIIPELHLLEIERELLGGDAVELDQPFLSEGPEAFQSIDIDFSAGISLFVVDPQMAITAEHQSVIATEFISVNDRSATHCLECHIQQRGCGDVFDDIDPDHSISLQNAENRDFMVSSPAAFPLSLSSKVRFVHFDLAAQKIVGFRSMGDDGLSDHGDRLEGRRIANPELLRYLPGREFEFEELKDPEPGLGRDFDFIKPATGEVVKSVSTVFAAELLIADSIDFIAPTTTAKNVAVFPAEFTQITSRLIFCVNNEFKGF